MRATGGIVCRVSYALNELEPFLVIHFVRQLFSTTETPISGHIHITAPASAIATYTHMGEQWSHQKRT